MKQRVYILLLIFFGLSFGVMGQSYWSDSTLVLEGRIVGTDTLPAYDIGEVRVYPKKIYKSRRHRRRYTRLMRNVIKAYPFALIARNELRMMNDSMQLIDGDRERKQFIKEYERHMFTKYEDGLRKLTFTQGRIMLKLIDREIGNTSYILIQEYRGHFSAAFWQGVARIFGSNLKSEYDANGEDAEIEEIILLIEGGFI